MVTNLWRWCFNALAKQAHGVKEQEVLFQGLHLWFVWNNSVWMSQKWCNVQCATGRDQVLLELSQFETVGWRCAGTRHVALSLRHLLAASTCSVRTEGGKKKKTKQPVLLCNDIMQPRVKPAGGVNVLIYNNASGALCPSSFRILLG